MKLEWSPAALADRDAIFDFIEFDSPRSAISVDEAIEAKADQLIDFPEIGRVGRVDGTRELVLTSLPYVLVYIIRPDTVLILRVLHGARQWPDDMSH